MLSKITIAIGVLGIGLALVACEELPVEPDTTPPVVSITSPSANTTHTDSIRIAVNATDNVGVSKVEVFITGRAQPVARDTVAPYNMLVPLVELTPGPQQFYAVATDEAGNAGFSTTIPFTSQRTPGLKFLGQIRLDGTVLDVAISGDIAAVAAGDGGVIAIDISNVFLPQWIGRFDAGDFMRGVAIVGQTIYAGANAGGVRTLTVNANSDTLLSVAWLRVEGVAAQQLSILDTTLSVAGGGGGLLQLNASQQDTLVELGKYDQGGDMQDVERIGNYVYTAEGDLGMRVLDVSNADSVFAVYQFVPSQQGQDLYLTGSHAYLADGDFGVHTFDISDPANPIFLSTYNASGRLVSGIKGEGRWVYTAVGDFGVDVLDAANPGVLVPVPGGNFNTTGLAFRLAAHRGYVFVADTEWLTILKYVEP